MEQVKYQPVYTGDAVSTSQLNMLLTIISLLCQIIGQFFFNVPDY